VEQMRIQVRTEAENKGRFAIQWERTEASFVFTLL